MPPPKPLKLTKDEPLRTPTRKPPLSISGPYPSNAGKLPNVTSPNRSGYKVTRPLIIPPTSPASLASLPTQNQTSTPLPTNKSKGASRNPDDKQKPSHIGLPANPRQNRARQDSNIRSSENSPPTQDNVGPTREIFPPVRTYQGPVTALTSRSSTTIERRHVPNFLWKFPQKGPLRYKRRMGKRLGRVEEWVGSLSPVRERTQTPFPSPQPVSQLSSSSVTLPLPKSPIE
jgi:hypothetical protein